MIERHFDVFLAHHSEDKPLIRKIYHQLKARGLNPWLDEEEIPPGTSFQDELQQAIGQVKTAAICIGTNDLGRWQALELKAFITQCVKRNIPVIPVLLPSVAAVPDSLLFLSEFHAVSFQNGIEDERALLQMEWGITRKKPRPKPLNSLPPLKNIPFNYPSYLSTGRTAQEPHNLGGFADVFESFFQGFSLENGSPSSIGRTKTDRSTDIEESREWAGEWFVNVGENQGHLLWEDCVRYGCISAGGGQKYRDAIQKLKPDNIVYAYITGAGYVGYGKVVEHAVPVRDFVAKGAHLLEQELATVGFKERTDKNDLEFSDWIVRIEWLKTYQKEQARFFSGAFVHRGTLCRLGQKETLEFLHQEFYVSDD